MIDVYEKNTLDLKHPTFVWFWKFENSRLIPGGFFWVAVSRGTQSGTQGTQDNPDAGCT